MATENFSFVDGITLQTYPCDTWDQARTGLFNNQPHVTVQEPTSVAAIEPSGILALGFPPAQAKYDVRQIRMNFGNIDLTGLTALTLTFRGQINSAYAANTNAPARDVSFDVMYETYTPPGDYGDFKSYGDISPIGSFVVPWSVGVDGLDQTFTITLPLPASPGFGQFGILITPTVQRATTVAHSDWFNIWVTTAVLAAEISDIIRPPRPHFDPLIEFFTDVAAEKILNMALCVGGDLVTLPDKLYLALYSSPCSRTTPGTELTGAGYTRIEVPSMTPVEETPHWKVTNPTDIVFPTATSDWALATHWAMWSDASAGEYLCQGKLHQAVLVQAGNAFVIPTGWMILKFGFVGCPHPLTEQVMLAFFVQDITKDPLDYFSHAGDDPRLFTLQFYTSAKPNATDAIDIDGAAAKQISFAVAAAGKVLSNIGLIYGIVPPINVGKVVTCAALIVDGAPWPLTDGNLAGSGFNVPLISKSYEIPAGNLSVEIF